jgi:hypothetical protein
MRCCVATVQTEERKDPSSDSQAFAPFQASADAVLLVFHSCISVFEHFGSAGLDDQRPSRPRTCGHRRPSGRACHNPATARPSHRRSR